MWSIRNLLRPDSYGLKVYKGPFHIVSDTGEYNPVVTKKSFCCLFPGHALYLMPLVSAFMSPKI